MATRCLNCRRILSLSPETDSCPIAGMAHIDKPWFGYSVSSRGDPYHRKARISSRILSNRSVPVRPLWTPANIVEDAIRRVQEQVGNDRVLLGLSGGVDSSVVAALLHRAIGEQLTCVLLITACCASMRVIR
jgi:GMP synthase (glutamine-hydrolysing)